MIKDWITANWLDVEWDGSRVFRLDGKTFLYLEPKDGKIFNDDFTLIIDDIEQEAYNQVVADYFVFGFGGKVYYTPTDTLTLNILKYIGKAKDFSGFDNLGVHGPYEICSGSRDYADWCRKAKFLSVGALGICERHTLAGTLKFQDACQKAGIKSIIGETVLVRNEAKDYFVKLYVANATGWANLLRIHKNLNIDNKGEFVDEQVLVDRAEGLYLVFDSQTDLHNKILVLSWLHKFEGVFYQFDTVKYRSAKIDIEHLERLKNYLHNFAHKIQPILICDTYYLDAEDHQAKVLLHKIKGTFHYQSRNQHFKSLEEVCEEVLEMFTTKPENVEIFHKALANIQVVVDGCNFQIPTGKVHLPRYNMTKEEADQYETNEDLFWGVITDALVKLDVEDKEPYYERIEREYDIIFRGGFIDYFLILRDVVNWAEANDVMVGTGRGSAGGSLVAMLMNITKVDPLQYDLIFERFLNESRIGKGLPDIDIDFASKGRLRVKAYMEERFGKHNVCFIGTYTGMKTKSTFRELLRLRGEQPQTINYYSAIISESNESMADLFREAAQVPKLKEYFNQFPDVINNIPLILGQAKTSSIHAAGVIITPNVDEDGNEMQIYDWLPCKIVDDNLISEWEGEQLDSAGFLKADILGLGQLDKLSDMLKLIEQRYGEKIDLNFIDINDPEVYELFKKGLTQDVFQFGTDGLAAYCRDVAPTSITELAVMNALHRPGPMDVDAHTDYIKIKFGKKDAEYDWGTEEVLKDTYGLLVYQEQAIRIVQRVGGFTLTEGDGVRKSTGKKDLQKMQSYKEKFIEGSVKNGCPEYQANVIWNKIEQFAGYGFNKCISGDEKFYKVGHQKNIGLSSWQPTIGEMYKIKNYSGYAKSTGHIHLHRKYKHWGYGSAFSLDDRHRLVRNKIKDIFYSGVQNIYRVTVESGEYIDVTLNHKFPLPDGSEKQLKQLGIGDELIINDGYRQDPCSYIWNLGTSNVPKKGQMGFQKMDTPYTRFLEIRKELLIQHKVCQICNKKHRRLEVHHRDGDHGNSEKSNMVVLCPSCHKKEEYKLGRVTMGKKGLYTRYEKIKSIHFLKMGEVYDVEMEHPYHTFVTKNNIVTSNSHAVEYSLIGYQTQWLKKYFPLEFWTVSLQYAKDDEIHQRINEINKFEGINLSGPDVNKSRDVFYTDWETNTIYWSLPKIKQIADKATASIITEREANGEFYSLEEFHKRLKGKSVDSRVVKNLIFAGAFDNIYGVREPIERKKILDEYAGLYPLSKLDYTDEQLCSDFFWYKQQKELSGFGFFKYELLVDDFLFDRSEYAHPSQVQMSSNIDCYVVVAGMLLDYKIRKTRKGEAGKLTLENNNETIDVMLWAETWGKFKSELEKSVGECVMLSGKIQYDSYNKKNTVYSYDKTIVHVWK